ncbi:peptidase domain-containing ABC transporter [Acetivibrio saccincola]|uniref:Bacteriocin ABC transporter ATP-binding protein n=2 Tax=Acetivibrio saccincola TaxID=1677857 RepID=A0A2S8R8J0_9FIRM|nr:peptidase domain-containing ABC transporter [Acetivibrio saccincola]PQQ66120.1 bacteriocin ABC transporter ATP-binding protein [Acetivibrio saccincola]HOA97963.1 peptidase domain-containing ABC transporter [Acetivibrio saccincola]HQD29921.1 peptidase domain-containing ABC transporter [Acetivibrio saccincola]
MLKNPFKKYYCIRQHDITDCGAACLATISRQYGLKIPITKIREVAGTDKQGTNAYGVVKAAEQLGFTAKAVKGNQEAFFSKFPLPAIAHVIVDGMLLHYVVIHKITEKEVIVADPGKGIVKYTPEEFFKLWTGILILLVPSPKFKKGDETKSIFSRFFGLLLPQKRLVINIFLTSLIYTILGILGSFYFKFMMDDILPNNLTKTLHIVSIGVILLNLFKIILNAFRSHLMLYLSQKLDISLILGYYNHVLELPMNFFGSRKVGEIVSRFMDASKVREAISGATLTIMIDTLMAIAGGIILYIQNSFLFGIAFLMVIAYAVIVFAFNKPIKNINRKQMENNAQLTSYLVESLNGIETIKAFNAERKSNIETEKKFIKFLKSVFKGGWIYNLKNSLSGFVALVGSVVILWVGAYNVLNGEMTIGQLLAFNALLAYFLDPIKNLIELQPMMQTAIVASDRLGEILDLELEKSENEDKKITPSTLKGTVEYKNVDFRYGTRELVLKNINLKVDNGEKIALVGESGSGKTTLVKLLLSLYKAEKGEILINGYNINDININYLRDRIAYISQDVFLFSGTIYENLTLGIENPDMEAVIEAAKMARAHDFINSMPLRYETMLEENGANLSGGQKQRIAIARALLKKPDILIMDEATSNLDSITEKAIERTINEHTKGVTTFIIAHRLSTIMRCDKIFVMDKGEIVECGTHKELINKKGFYYNLWKEQLSETTEETIEREETSFIPFVEGFEQSAVAVGGESK